MQKLVSVLIENFNKSNQSMPHYERHENFVTDIELFECGLVQTLTLNERCSYVETTPSCMESETILNYIHLIYCVFAPKTRTLLWFYIFVLLICEMYMFWLLGTAADIFFCPALKIIAQVLGMSQTLAGVTLLAFGNGSSDFFTTLATLEEAEGSQFSSTMGSTVFVSLFVGGMVIVSRPFMQDEFPFQRDLFYLIFAVMFVEYSIKSDKHITIVEAYLILLIYISYLLVVAIDEILLRQTEKALIKQIKQDDENEDLLRKLEAIQMQIGRNPIVETEPRISTGSGRNHNLLEQFFASINPIDLEEWHSNGLISNFILIVKIPMMIFLNFLIPLADLDLELNGWTKLLNCMQIVILPFFSVLVTGNSIAIFGVSLPILSMFVTIPIAILTFIFTRTDQVPHYHFIYAIFAVVGSVLVIYVVASEIVGILKALGLVTMRSQSFLSVTILAWGNSIGDLMANVALAKSGYPKMAFSACIGGPLFYNLMGNSITYIYQTTISETNTYEASAGLLGENCLVFLLINLLLAYLATYLNNFKARTSIGVTMILIYLIFFLFCSLGEFKIMHMYGTDHREDNSF